MIKHRDALLGKAALIFAALFWGGEFVAAKDVLSSIPPNWCNAVRFFFAAMISLVIWRKQFKTATKADWKRGITSGLLLGMGYALQTMGLEHVNAGINAFISASYVVIVPFIVWYIEKSKPENKQFICAVIAIAGVVSMSVTGIASGDLRFGMGEILSFGGALSYAGAIVAIDCYSREMDVSLLTGMQFIVTTVISAVLAMVLEPAAATFNGKIFLEFVYLVVLGTFLTQILFNFGVKYVSSEKASIILSLESISAVFFGMLFLGERISIQQIIGILLVLSAILISNLEAKHKAKGEEI